MSLLQIYYFMLNILNKINLIGASFNKILKHANENIQTKEAESFTKQLSKKGINISNKQKFQLIQKFV